MRGKVIAITGASSGIGEATARLLAKEGAELVLGARRTDRLHSLAAEIEAGGGIAVPLPLDVTNRDAMAAFVDGAIGRFGRLDVLVSNAGTMLLGPLSDLRVDEWDRMIDTNIKGLLNGIAAALPVMKAQGGGHFVTVGSVAGRQAMQTNAVYAATKFAVRALADGLRLEGGETIRSTLVSPGAVATELFDKVIHADLHRMLQEHHSTSLDPDVIARTIAFAIQQPPEVDVSEIIVRPIAHKY